MGLLDITDLTIGYSSKGANTYVDNLNTKVIDETDKIISSGIQDIESALKEGWQGQACDNYIAKLNQSGIQLKESLLKMKEVFEATMAVQEETYYKQDVDMAEQISQINVFGGN